MAAVTATTARPGVATRKVGYVVAVLVNAALLVVVNVWPGWDALPFLSGDADLVVSLVNASILVNLVANVVYAVRDPSWLKAGGDIVTLGVGALVMVRIWQIFPFDLGADPFDWALVVRIALAVGIVGSCVGMLVALRTFVRSALDI